MHAKLLITLLACSMVASAAELAANSLEIVDPGPFPMMKRAQVNPVFAIKVDASAAGTPGTLTFNITPSNSIENIILRTGGESGEEFKDSIVVGEAKPNSDGKVTIKCKEEIPAGETWLWVDATPSEKSDVGGVVGFSKIEANIGSKKAKGEGEIKQRIGYMVALAGENVAQVGEEPTPAKKVLKKKSRKKGNEKPVGRKCNAFRIPGLITTEEGTLIGCFDARYNHEGDLCSDIDVAVVRSTDGGQTWTTPYVAMDAGPGGENGCGDPCILQDKKGRIWLQSLAAHFGGGAVLSVSQKGQGEDKTGQWIMTYSDDDGKTWATEFVNPTEEIKKDEWNCILAGPGRGIVTRRGVIVFPAQIWISNPPKGTPNCSSTICYSKDGGKTWAYGEGLPTRTSECQVVELRDGSIMINARNENRGGARAVFVTKDLGKTWQPHETNHKALEESTCQASILAAKMKKAGRILLFSNPKTTQGRNQMTIRLSKDDGMTWSDGYEYDRRKCAGYSCLTQIDDQNIGVFYETSHRLSGYRGIGFLRLPIEAVLSEKTEAAGTPVKTAKPKSKAKGKKKRVEEEDDSEDADPDDQDPDAEADSDADDEQPTPKSKKRKKA